MCCIFAADLCWGLDVRFCLTLKNARPIFGTTLWQVGLARIGIMRKFRWLCQSFSRPSKVSRRRLKAAIGEPVLILSIDTLSANTLSADTLLLIHFLLIRF